MFENKSDSEDGFIEIVHPSPEVVYQSNLLYLAKICELINEKYNKECVWGDLEDE